MCWAATRADFTAILLTNLAGAAEGSVRGGAGAGAGGSGRVSGGSEGGGDGGGGGGGGGVIPGWKAGPSNRSFSSSS